MSERAQALEAAIEASCETAMRLNLPMRELVARIRSMLRKAPPVGVSPQPLDADDVEWVVNDNAELGVKIGQQFFFCYKGHSLVYETGQHDDGRPMMWRRVFKREFGECIHPVNYSDPSRIGTVSLSDDDGWQPLPASLSPVTPDTPFNSTWNEREGRMVPDVVEPTPEPPQEHACGYCDGTGGVGALTCPACERNPTVEPAPPTPAPCVWREAEHKNRIEVTPGCRVIHLNREQDFENWRVCPYCGGSLECQR